MQIDVQHILWFGSICVGLVCTLVGMIWKMLTERIKRLQEQLASLETKQEVGVNRVYDHIKQLSEDSADTRVTLAGVKEKFITRKECSGGCGTIRSGRADDVKSTSD